MSKLTLYDKVCISLEDCEFRSHGLCQAGFDSAKSIYIEQDKSKLYVALFENQRKIFKNQTYILEQKER